MLCFVADSSNLCNSFLESPRLVLELGELFFCFPYCLYFLWVSFDIITDCLFRFLSSMLQTSLSTWCSLAVFFNLQVRCWKVDEYSVPGRGLLAWWVVSWTLDANLYIFWSTLKINIYRHFLLAENLCKDLSLPALCERSREGGWGLREASVLVCRPVFTSSGVEPHVAHPLLSSVLLHLILISS